MNPKGPTVEPKASLEAPQGCQRGAQKRSRWDAFLQNFYPLFWPRDCIRFFMPFGRFGTTFIQLWVAILATCLDSAKRADPTKVL